MKRNFIPMELQLFAGEGGDGQAGESGAGTQQGAQAGQQAGAAFDYDKLAGIIAGKQNEAEATILKKYFRQQGLSKEEAETAINAFKEQKRASEPDVGELQDKLKQADAMVRDAVIEKEGTLLAIGVNNFMSCHRFNLIHCLKLSHFPDIQLIVYTTVHFWHISTIQATFSIPPSGTFCQFSMPQF